MTTQTTTAQVLFKSTMDVALIKAAASDTDVVMAARVSTLGESSKDSTSDEGLIRYLMRERHGSPFEHATMTFLISAPIFVFRELMRHRMASYNEESARYRQLEPVFYVPDATRSLVQVGKPGRYDFRPGSPEQTRLVQDCYSRVCSTAYEAYESMLEEGIAREVARGVLPVTIYSSAYMTVNSRSLMNVLSLRRRVEGATYPSYPQREIEMVAEQMEACWSKLMPLTHSAFESNGRVSP